MRGPIVDLDRRGASSSATNKRPLSIDAYADGAGFASTARESSLPSGNRDKWVQLVIFQE